MINRFDLKERAKRVLSEKYWLIVGLVALAVVLGASTVPGFSFSVDLHGSEDSFMSYLGKAFTLFAILLGSVGIAYTLFAGNMVTVGAARVTFTAYKGGHPTIKQLFSGFIDGRYWSYFGPMALRTLFISLGLMCFVIPGIVVGLGLSQVPYLLAKGEELSPMEAIRRSWDMMNGHKWELFVLGLSFLGWEILNLMTFGVLGLFYVNPYMALTYAGYHDALCGAEYVPAA